MLSAEDQADFPISRYWSWRWIINQTKSSHSVQDFHGARLRSVVLLLGPTRNPTVETFVVELRSTTGRNDLKSLPLILRYVMTACRGLGVRYVWIDSPCIIQDSREDWGKEVAKMATVYENALFNISASAAADSTQGCFRDRYPLCSFTRPFPWELTLILEAPTNLFHRTLIPRMRSTFFEKRSLWV